MKNLTLSLNDLTSWLDGVLPELLAELNPPASSEDISRLTHEFGGNIPDDVNVLLSWHNGGPIPDPWWELSEIDDIIRVKQMHDSLPELKDPPNWWRDTWIPIGHDSAGNHICVDLEGCFGGNSGQIVIFMHDDEERKIIAPSLSSYFELLVLACRQGILTYDDEDWFDREGNQEAWEDFVAEQLSGYPKIASAYL